VVQINDLCSMLVGALPNGGHAAAAGGVVTVPKPNYTITVG